MTKAIILLAEGFEECEALCPGDVLNRGGVSVTYASVGDRTVASSHGVKMTADTVLSSKTLEEDWDIVFLPGGMPGAKNLAASPTVRKLLLTQNEKAKTVAAICASPAVVLGPLGLLDGRKATVFPGCESYYPGFDFSSDGVVVSGNVVTAKSAGWAFDLGLKLLEITEGRETAEKVKNQIYYKEGQNI